MTQVALFKKKSDYTDKDGKEKKATNFYVKCGDVLVPIEVKYFPDKETQKDNSYASRKAVLSAFSEELPELDSNKKPTAKQEDLQPIPDQNLPF